jgi:hypothetical protein
MPSRLTTRRTKRGFKGNSDDDEHDSDTDGGVIAGNGSNDTDYEHKQAHQGNTGKVHGSTTDTTND